MIKRFFLTTLKELRLKRLTIISYTFAAFAFLLMYAAVYPAVQDQSAKFTELFSSYPKEFLEAFSISQIRMDTYENYLAMEHFSIIWPLMVALLTVTLSGFAIAGEIEKRTMSIMLSLPMSRLNIFFAKYTAGIIALLIFSFISIMAAVPLAWIFDFGINSSTFWATLLISLAFGWALLGLGFCISSFFSEKGQAYLILGGTLLLMYVINVISQLVNSIDWLKYFSIFNYYKPTDIMTGASLDVWSTLVLCAVAIISTLFGALWFKRRDVIT